MSDPHVRDATAGDRAAIEHVTLSAYQEYAPIMQAGWEHYRENILGTLADITTAEQFVAEQDGAIVGTVLLFPAASAITLPDGSTASRAWPEIRLLAVAPAARG